MHVANIVLIPFGLVVCFWRWRADGLTGCLAAKRDGACEGGLVAVW